MVNYAKLHVSIFDGFGLMGCSILAFPIEEAIHPYNCASFIVLHTTRKTVNHGVKSISVKRDREREWENGSEQNQQENGVKKKEWMKERKRRKSEAFQHFCLLLSNSNICGNSEAALYLIPESPSIISTWGKHCHEKQGWLVNELEIESRLGRKSLYNCLALTYLLFGIRLSPVWHLAICSGKCRIFTSIFSDGELKCELETF
jgi:hypothetical protein